MESFKTRVLYVGDSETVVNNYVLGADIISHSYFNDNGKWFREALEREGVCVTHLTPHDVPSGFPTTAEELSEFDAVVFSDVGYNSISFYPGFGPPFKYPLGPDRVRLLESFVADGGGFLMAGGYLSFAGMNGVARWGGTAVEEMLPVEISRVDDRVEVTEGLRFQIDDPEHPVVRDLPWDAGDWTLCGYNRVKLKDGASLVASYADDPMIACGEFGKGRTAVFSSDFAPHWAGDFVHWPHYSAFWRMMIEWLTRRS